MRQTLPQEGQRGSGPSWGCCQHSGHLLGSPNRTPCFSENSQFAFIRCTLDSSSEVHHPVQRGSEATLAEAPSLQLLRLLVSNRTEVMGFGDQKPHTLGWPWKVKGLLDPKYPRAQASRVWVFGTRKLKSWVLGLSGPPYSHPTLPLSPE